MKLLVILLLFSSYCLAQAKKESKEEDKPTFTKEEIEQLQKDAEERRKHWPYIAKFINKEYTEKFEKEIPKIESRIDFYKKKLAVATTPATKKKYQEDIKSKQIELEVAKMWRLYEQTFIIYNKAYDEKDNDKYEKGIKLSLQIIDRYQKLTAEGFPNPTSAFYKKYGERLKKAKAP